MMLNGLKKTFSVQIGDFLYKHFFSIYNMLYPVFKEKQDAYEIALIRKLVKPGDVVLDIGANIGFYAKIFSKIVGNTGKVHSFEPDSNNYSHLKDNLRKS